MAQRTGPSSPDTKYPRGDNPLNPVMSRRDFLKGLGVLGGLAVSAKAAGNIVGWFAEKAPPATLEQYKAEFERMSTQELAQWILDSTGNVATADQPVRTPANTAAYKDLKNMAEGKSAHEQSLLTLDGKNITMDVEVNRDILVFRALLIVALRNPANYVEGKPILIQSGQLTNRSGSQKGRQDKSHFYGSSIDFSGAIIDGAKSDEYDDNLYPYDSPINQRLGAIADDVGVLVGVETSQVAGSLERVDSLHGVPGLSKGHYHYNASSNSAKEHAATVRRSLMDQPEMHFQTDAPVLKLSSAGASSRGREFIHTYEDFRSTTYHDAGNGKGTLTIGYGATYYLKGTVITRGGQKLTIENDNEKPRMGDTITKDEADRLSIDMIKQGYTRPVISALEKYGMAVTQSQMDALVSYSFNRGGLNAERLINRLKKLADAGHGDDALAINAAFMYDINTVVAPKFRDGITDRYLDTAAMYVHGDYRRKSHPFDPQAWDVIIATYFG